VPCYPDAWHTFDGLSPELASRWTENPFSVPQCVPRKDSRHSVGHRASAAPDGASCSHATSVPRAYARGYSLTSLRDFSHRDYLSSERSGRQQSMALAMGRGGSYTQPAPAGRHLRFGLQALSPLTGLGLMGGDLAPMARAMGYYLSSLRDFEIAESVTHPVS